MAPFGRLIRFKDESGVIQYGEAPANTPLTKENLHGTSVPIYRGDKPWDNDFSLAEEQKVVGQVLAPVSSVPIFMCIGLNYKQHADEAGMTYPKYPVVFTKPPDALAGPFEDIPIHPECENMDYEAELAVVIGKDCKNLTEKDDVFEYILGYAASNDCSARIWQTPDRSGMQHGSAKSFDKFAPIGPAIISRDIIPDPKQLRMKAIVNGEVRQSTMIEDMIFDIPALIRHLSRGMTLRKGTVIMTGTPSGVAFFMKPPRWLQDGDIVEIEVEKVGTISNRMVFEKR